MIRPKISVIVPVYNVESYLHYCLDSILNQTFKDFEIILINDGSSDNSGNICDEYAKIDNRLRVFHKTNGGVSSARNFGLQYARGEWICFIDSDDWIKPGTLSIIKDIEDKEIDFVQFGFQLINSSGDIIVHSNIPTNKLMMEKKEYFNTKMYHHAICGYFIKYDIIKKSNIIFPENIKYGEDQAFILKSLMCCHKVLITNGHFYNYRYREGSAMNSSISFSRAEDHLKVIKDIDSFMAMIQMKLTYLHKYIFTELIISYIRLGIDSTFNLYKVKKQYSIFCNNIDVDSVLNLCKSYDSYFIMLICYIKTRLIIPVMNRLKRY